jgi:glyceraldehyde-3-phosphate dehydrogenase (NADP+)
MKPQQLFLKGEWRTGVSRAAVRSPWNHHVVSEVEQAGPPQIEEALAFAFASRARLRALSTGQRREVLFKITEGLTRRSDELVDSIVHEAGKPLLAARREVSRAIETFRLASAELSSFGGRTLPIDLDATSQGYTCQTARFPAGVVVGIVPFNFPLNLGAHKVAPALAVGAPIIVKPPPQAPTAQLLLAQLAQEAGADPAALQVLPCGNAEAERLATDPRVRVLSFTGSARVGWHLKAKAAGQVVLELGGNAAAIIAKDADLDWAAERCAQAGFGYAGQVCIKVQRIYVENPAFASFSEKFLSKVHALQVGDPAKENTVVGPVIDDGAAARIDAWVKEAVAQGAKLLSGGTREGRLLAPTVLTSVPKSAKVVQEEIFGPVVVLEPVDTFEAGLEAANEGQYGLQAGVFTPSLERARRAFQSLEVGGVIVNDCPTFRSDNAPYGGVKGSGLGREGVRYAMAEFTEERALVVAR